MYRGLLKKKKKFVCFSIMPRSYDHSFISFGISFNNNLSK